MLRPSFSLKWPAWPVHASTFPSIHPSIHLSSIHQSIIHPSYSPPTSLFTEQITPDTLQMTPRLSMHTSISRSLTVRRPHCSLRWNRHGRMSVMAAPVTLPVKPINRENLGTSRASRYDVISKAPRTNRAGRDTPRPLCLEYGETPASVERLKRRSLKGALVAVCVDPASNFCLCVAPFWLMAFQSHLCRGASNFWTVKS